MSEEKKSRRQYTTEQKLALLDEADQPGQSVALVGRKHGDFAERDVPVAAAA